MSSRDMLCLNGEYLRLSGTPSSISFDAGIVLDGLFTYLQKLASWSRGKGVGMNGARHQLQLSAFQVVLLGEPTP